MSFESSKIGICLPITKQTPLSYDFFLSYVLMNKPNEYQLIVPRLEVDGSSDSIASMRNDMVVQAIETECTHIAMLDTDQTYPQNTLEHLYNLKLPIVWSKVHRRYPPFDPILYRKDPEFDDWQKMYQIPSEEWKGKDIIKVDATGSGCWLAETEIFFNLKDPWFRNVRENPRLGRKRVGEDVFFCAYRLAPAGYEVWVDLTLNIGHEAKININETFYDLVNMVQPKFNKIDTED